MNIFVNYTIVMGTVRQLCNFIMYFVKLKNDEIYVFVEEHMAVILILLNQLEVRESL